MDWIKELLDTIALRHPELKNGGFAHVANVGKLRVEHPYELTDGLHIRPASQEEATTLHSLVSRTRTLNPMNPGRNPYETKLNTVENGPTCVSYSTTDLPPKEWRYHVIDFGAQDRLYAFVSASVLTQSRLELGSKVFHHDSLKSPTFTLAGPALERVWAEMADNDDRLLQLGGTELSDLQNTNQKLSSLEADHTWLRRAIQQFTQLDQIPKQSPLRFLGYVSVLESMITHQPAGTDTIDSITRQVRQKMILLGRRAKIPIPYEPTFRT